MALYRLDATYQQGGTDPGTHLSWTWPTKQTLQNRVVRLYLQRSPTKNNWPLQPFFVKSSGAVLASTDEAGWTTVKTWTLSGTLSGTMTYTDPVGPPSPVYNYRLIGYYAIPQEFITTYVEVDWATATVTTQVSGTCVLQRMFGSTQTYGSIQPYCVAVDSQNNVIIGGLYLYNSDFGDGVLYGTNGNNSTDSFIAKYSPTGTLLWVKTLGQISVDGIMGLVVLSDDTIVALGYSYIGQFAANIDIGSGAQNWYGQTDIFLCKLASVDGAFIWTKPIGTDASDGSKEVMCMAKDANDNIYLASQFALGLPTIGSVTSDLQLSQVGGTTLAKPLGSPNTCLIKLNSSAVYQWAVAIGGSDSTSQIFPAGIAFDTSNNPILYVQWKNSISAGGAVLTNTSKSDTLFIKYSATDGSFIFQRRIGEGAGTVRAKGIASYKADGSFVIVGETASATSQVDFGDGIVTGAQGGQLFVAKYTQDNVFMSKYILQVGDTPPSAMCVAVDSFGSIFFLGLVTGLIDFGDGHFILGETGGQDMFRMKRDQSNNLVYVIRDGPAGEIGKAACFRHNDENLIVVGSCGAPVKNAPGNLHTGATNIIFTPNVYNNAWFCQFSA